MCGIAGILYFNQTDKTSLGIVKDMCNKMAYRGPDGQGFYFDTNIVLGHRRLSIIDLTEDASQPMKNEDGSIIITYNGEIYNYAELKRLLLKKGHIFKSHSDTEVIIHLYEEMGVECLSQLRGMFAFAIWDAKQKLLFCARDRMGIKPFHYYWNGKSFVFASEIKAVLCHPDVPRELNLFSLKDYLYFKYPIGSQTFFKDINTLEPGYYIIVKNSSVSKIKYWDVIFSGDSPDDLDKSVVKVSNLFEESIKYHMVSDVPLGTFLSGGIDSSGISCIASNYCPTKIKSFCCGSITNDVSSDRRYASLVSNHLNTDHYEIILSAEKFFDFAQQAIWHLDEPGGGSTAIPVYFTAKKAREQIKVLLSGEGSDEIFGGYNFYIRYFIETNFLKFNSQISQPTLFSYLPAYLKMTRSRELFLKSLLKGVLPKSKDYIEIRPNLRTDKSFNIISHDVLASVSDYEPFENLWNKYLDGQSSQTFVDKIQYLDIKTYLSRILHINDRMCMAVSLENRVPMLDHKLVEFAAKIPASQRFYKLIPKYPLRTSLCQKLPASVLSRPKTGFTLPVKDWFRNELRDQVEDIILGKKALNRGIYDPKGIKKIWRKHLKGEDHTERIWAIISIELWHRLFLD